MSTQEERLDTLEQRVADIELERLYEKRKAASSTPSEQAYDAKQINHRLTMLLGIVSGQEQAIKSMEESLTTIRDYTQQIDRRLDSVDRRMESGFEMIGKQFVAIESRFDRLEKIILDHLPPPQ
jgi:uncharacterized coiled-coil protein SlyX